MKNLRRLSLKECWIYAKEDLVKPSRTLKKITLAFLEKKAMNTAFCYYHLKHNKFLKPFLYTEMHFYSFIEFRTRKLWKKI